MTLQQRDIEIRNLRYANAIVCAAYSPSDSAETLRLIRRVQKHILDRIQATYETAWERAVRFTEQLPGRIKMPDGSIL